MGKPFQTLSGGIGRLKGSSNHANWKATVEMRLRSEGVWGYVDGTETKSPPASSSIAAIATALQTADLQPLDRIKLEIESERLAEQHRMRMDEWEKKKALAADIIFSSMDLPLQTLFETQKTNPKELWDEAEKQFAEKGFTYLYDSVMALTSLRLSDCNNMEDYCTKFKTLQHQLAAMKSEPPKEWYNTLFIGGLGTKFEIWQSRRRTDSSTKSTELETLMAEVREEARAQDSPTALLLRMKASQQRNGSRGPAKSKERGPQALDQKKATPSATCDHCHKAGHVEANCWKKYPDKRPQRQQGSRNAKNQTQASSIAAATTMDDTDEFCAVTGMALIVDSSLAEEWVVDSGATEHMSRVREWFTDYTPLTGKKVRQGDGFLTV